MKQLSKRAVLQILDPVCHSSSELKRENNVTAFPVWDCTGRSETEVKDTSSWCMTTISLSSTKDVLTPAPLKSILEEVLGEKKAVHG